ncbi:TPA: glycosyltransferase family 4 protein, partial [Enterococcus faecium]|nr:glycosyltransferase family 4 protein [Enterococcus faecium]
NKLLNIIPGENKLRAKGRHSDKICDEEVLLINEFSGLLLLILQRVKFLKHLYKKYWDFHNKKFNKKLIKYINSNIDEISGVIVFDQVSFDFFKKKINIPIILDMSAPSVVFMKSQFEKYGISTLKYDALLKKNNFEINSADFFIGASSITERSLLNMGIEKKQIKIFPYGVNIVKENDKLMNLRTRKKRLKFLFVGRVTLEKGIGVLDSFFEKFGIEDAWTFAGDYSDSKKFYEKYEDKVQFVGHVSKIKMFELYRDNDVLVFPSLADGFGLAVIEALSNGMYVICSDSTGAKDIIMEGKNGDVFLTGDENDLNNKIQYYKKNINKIDRLKIKETVNDLTWERYNKNIIKSLEYFTVGMNNE